MSTTAAPQIQDVVSGRLSAFFDRQQDRAAAYGDRYLALWEAIRHSSEGGKRVRPALVLETHRGLGGRREDDAVDVAVAFELLHTSFLLHDDVIDGDTVRRGRPNIVGQFAGAAERDGAGHDRAAGWGRAAAILAGDLMLHAAQRLVSGLDAPRQVRSRLLEILDDAVLATAAGELHDVAFSCGLESPDLDRVLSMTEWKTAHYSFQAPLQCAAELAGASRETVRALGGFGLNAGIAFQLRDDLLGVYGDERATGKSSSSDIRSGKVTALASFAARAGFADRLPQRASDGGCVTDAEVERIRCLLRACGAVSFVEGLIADYTGSALACLQEPGMPLPLRERLGELARRAGERSR